MYAYDLYILENDPILPVVDFFINESRPKYREEFLSQLNNPVCFFKDALKEDDPYYLNKLLRRYHLLNP